MSDQLPLLPGAPSKPHSIGMISYNAKGRARQRKWYYAHIDRARAISRHWQKANPEKVKAKMLRERFGITLERYKEMIAEQRGLCAICHKTMKPPCVDHDHKTKSVRALLCNACNQGLGIFQENQTNLRNAASYLEKWAEL